jgi:DNA-binding response OmpR family regulator
VCHVLIIEDEELIALDIEDILSRRGATSFDRADTEQGAIAAADAHRPDLITVDVVLRSGLGPAAIAAIRARHGAIPVIFITSTTDVCLSGDKAMMLRKPVNEAAVCRAFQALRDAA